MSTVGLLSFPKWQSLFCLCFVLTWRSLFKKVLVLPIFFFSDCPYGDIQAPEAGLLRSSETSLYFSPLGSFHNKHKGRISCSDSSGHPGTNMIIMGG